jgi:glucan phosphoethanolaminetransferase (alkaline phosphatase superfamily)
MLRLGSFLRNPFSFLFARSKMEEQVAAYLVREHAGGRRVDEILADHYVQNRLTPQQQARMLDRPEVVHALGTHDVDAARRYVAREAD